MNGFEAASAYVTGTGQQLTTHPRGRCATTWCVVHNPMPGPWDGWRTHWNVDGRVMERVCPCLVRHPVAEDYGLKPRWMLAHDCCGVCRCSPHDYIDGEVVERMLEP